ncbi:cobalt-precorrin-5B (C(1))-methyltransferase [Geotalea uraniireducens]|uniref:Cobalt-precorrin-5B C(1)-methyltransferase n=1 Tax=Geotalea uraniireducens (strain Rf4) TaxID=351605 RepID=A5GDU5_GEOUR|nr:cobalt-precorrin-5B (C(1))-methyltransferase [Geotalea uraniireducens]ABQ24252.1 cobalamin biosynthesis protein CbiD [Geotalea uraniireducens Rf4]
MANKPLKYGYTTGACAAAAAKGAAQMLRDRQLLDHVEIILPGGELAEFQLHGQVLGENSASCYVIKDAGDDPDVTNGAEIHASVLVETATDCGKGEVIISGGTGVGRVTKPGLAVAVGEWAINPVPRKMIRLVIHEVFAIRCMPAVIRVAVSIPNGEELAKKTLNARLGIIGGLSILGTTGIVKPISVKAWTDTIDAAIDVALACGSETVVLSTGRTSEMVAEKHFGIGDRGSGIGKGMKEESFIMMGDHAGYSLAACARKGVRSVVVAGQFAKLLKIACGHEQTHVASSELDLRTLAEWCAVADPRSQIPGYCLKANTARHVLEASGNDPELIALVCGRVRSFAEKLASGVEIKVLLAGYNGEVLYFG